MRRETDRDVYVYALSSPGLPRRLSVLGRRLQCIAIGGIDAIVERSGTPGRNLEDIQLQHRIVSRLAARASSLLPARFGSVVNDGALRSLVTDRHNEIEDALRLVRNCEQMTLRVFGPAEREDATDPPSGSGTAYLARRRQRARQQPPEVEIIRRELGALARAERAEAGERGVRLVVYHLVARRLISRYRRRASVLQTLLTPYAVTVTGPWPVFAFAPELF
jgi:Gas vesicle synthesis protein GvpL/GvpF